MKESEIIQYLIINKIYYVRDYSLELNSYSKTGKTVKLMICPDNIEKIVELVIHLRENNVDFKIIGNTTNILFLDSVEYSTFISTTFLTKLEFENNTVKVECGRLNEDFIRILVMRDICGFEALEGIPGTLGGCLYMNAGSYGQMISDNLISVSVLNQDNKIITLKKEECDFEYRNSIFRRNPNFIILSMVFHIQTGKRSDIYKIVEKCHISRHSYQEFVYPNLGSMFSSNVYRCLMKSRPMLKTSYIIVSFIFYNRIMRFFRRKRPNSSIRINLVLRYLKAEQLKKYISKKNINTFINCNYSSNEILNLLLTIFQNSNASLNLENEIYRECIFKILDESEYETSKAIIAQISQFQNGVVHS